jgi:hypothetical protein
MNRTFKAGSTAVTLFGVLGILGAGCLSRPVTNAAPQVNTNFTAVVHNQSVDKIDLLFMIDNSASMGDKQALLALAVPDMITRLVAPNCLDANGNPNGMTAATDGTCASGKAEFPPVHDMHIGVVTSSLGGRGGDQCDPTATNPANNALNAHNDDQGRLIARGGVSGNPTVENTPAPDLNSSNFLSWYPMVAANTGQPTLPPAVTAQATLVSDFATLVEGVHEHGCGFEAQNEAWYRFLVQPDPFGSITKVQTQAQLTGLDAVVLQQRHDFLRPDSLLAIIVVTDENEEAADPLSIGAQGWAFDNQNFPGSPNGASPQGTTDCLSFDPNNPTTTGPNSSSCTSCAFVSSSDPTFASRCPKDGATGASGYLDPLDDTLNTRFYHQKLRFGLFAGYPTSRYVRGMQSTTVPDSAHEHDGNGNYIGDQDMNANCVNPIYAQNLPTSGSGPTDPTLCNLTRGTRTPDLVYYAAIAGVPHQLLQSKPGDGTCPAGTAAADCPQKDTLTGADWKLIEGNDPENYDFSGADFHMIENWDPRTTPGAVWSAEEHGPLAGNIMANASACPPTMGGSVKGQALCDPINGREWATSKGDLQFSCIFDITPQYGGTGKDCSNAEYTGACDCSTTSINNGTQLCDSATPTLQVYGKAYPSVREMVIAKAMSNSPNNLDQGIVSSLCPIHVSDNAGGNDPLFGYRPAVNAIINRLKASLSNQCLPQKLVPDSLGIIPCLILVQLGQAVGPGACANPGAACVNGQGLLGPGDNPENLPNPPLSQDVLTKFCESQEATYSGMAGGPTDPDTFPTCALAQLLPVVNGNTNTADFPNGPTGGCSSAKDPGWCYVTGAAANGCPQAILFTAGEPPHGSTVSLQCIEQAVSVVDGGVSSGSSSSGSSSGGGD